LPKLRRKLHLLNATPLIKPLRRSWVIVNRVRLGAIARREGPVETIVETIGEAVKAALAAKGVQIGDPAVVRVHPDTKAGPVAAADGLSKGSRR
jgi:hypothetical protein